MGTPSVGVGRPHDPAGRGRSDATKRTLRSAGTHGRRTIEIQPHKKEIQEEEVKGAKESPYRGRGGSSRVRYHGVWPCCWCREWRGCKRWRGHSGRKCRDIRPH